MNNIELSDNGRCFACGQNNPIGLKLAFTTVDGHSSAIFTPKADHQGYAGITHGGILATILDEAMARALWDEGAPVVTASFEVRLKRPVPAGQPVRVDAWVESSRSRYYFCKSTLTAFDGELVAEATGKYIRV